MTFQFKIHILDIESPDVWRRLLVPGNFSFHHFHHIIQASFGWTNSHLYEYSPEGIGSDPVITHPEFEPENEYRNSLRFKLSKYFVNKGDKIIYTYDFGDSWEHSIVLEKRLPVDPNTTYPICTDGQLACPPEDCGGVPGFYDLVEALADPNHERHEEMLDWIGDDFDPQAFSVDNVNRMLAP